MSDNDKMLDDAIRKHIDLLDYYDAMGCKDDVQVQEKYIAWLAELQRYRAEPVKHGRWIHCPEEDENAWRCSECTGGWLLPDGGTPEGNYMRFCHRCGAKMDGDGGADDE